jgi:4-amino-4-deoxy-L-arabinose transferase-like glycosyltransferase
MKHWRIHTWIYATLVSLLVGAAVAIGVPLAVLVAVPEERFGESEHYALTIDHRHHLVSSKGYLGIATLASVSSMPGEDPSTQFSGMRHSYAAHAEQDRRLVEAISKAPQVEYAREVDASFPWSMFRGTGFYGTGVSPEQPAGFRLKLPRQHQAGGDEVAVLWAGLVGNVLLWTIAVLAVLIGLDAARRGTRGSRGLCRGCGYPSLAGAERCPECGVALRAD